MGKTEEVESILRESIETVIRHGVVLISGEYGVAWSPEQGLWAWDHVMFTQAPHCCSIGAYIIANQPGLDGKGDIYDAAVAGLKVDPVYLRDVMNGFDDFCYQGGYPDAFALGVRLRGIYRPLQFEYLALSGACGVQISDQYKNYLREYNVPAHIANNGFTPYAVPKPVPREPTSRTRTTGSEEDEVGESSPVMAALAG